MTGGTTTVYIFSGTKVLAEYENGATPGSPTREYIYTSAPLSAGSALLATIESSVVKYQISDHLSARVLTDSSGTVVGQRAHYPFGESWYETGTTTKWQFTSYERDGESGNDYAMFRTYVNRLGRFNAPDPLAGSPGDPQALNRYAYVLNDPCNYTDPLGLQACTLTVGSTAPLPQATRTTVETIFRNAGVLISWTGNQNANLRVQTGVWLRQGFGYNPPGSNIAQIDTAAINWAAIRPFSGVTPTMESFSAKTATGVVIAHEFGHYLLRQGSHSASGLMRPGNVQGTTVFQIDIGPGGGQTFTPEQAAAIRRRCDELHPKRAGGGSELNGFEQWWEIWTIRAWGYREDVGWYPIWWPPDIYPRCGYGWRCGPPRTN